MSIEQDFVKAIQNASKPMTQAYDTTATVVRVEGSTAWVHIDGGIEETPVERTIDCQAGDTIRVRLSGGQAYIIGNNSAPPTDDALASRALQQANAARKNASQALVIAEKIRQTVVGDYVASGTSGVHRLSSTLLQKPSGVNIYNDIDTPGDTYAHIDGTGFSVRKVVSGDVIDDGDPEIAHFGAAIKIGENLSGSNAAGTIVIGSGKLDTSGSHSSAIGYTTGAYSSMTASGEGASVRGLARQGGTIEAAGDGSTAEGTVGEDSSIQATGTGSATRGMADTDGDMLASGDGATAQGLVDDDGNLQATGDGSFATGYAAGGAILADAQGSIAEGYSEYEISSTGRGARACGYSDGGLIQATGIGSYAGGKADEDIIASGDGSFAHGNGVLAGAAAQAVFGRNNDNQPDTLLEVGNGTGHGLGEQSNAFEVYDNGRFGTPGFWFSVNASGIPCMSYDDGN